MNNLLIDFISIIFKDYTLSITLSIVSWIVIIHLAHALRMYYAYAAIMAFKRVSDTSRKENKDLPILMKWLAYPFSIYWYLWDCWLSITLMSILCLDFQISTISGRLKGYNLGTRTRWIDNYRKKYVRLLEDSLDKLDPSGNHI